MGRARSLTLLKVLSWLLVSMKPEWILWDRRWVLLFSQTPSTHAHTSALQPCAVCLGWKVKIGLPLSLQLQSFAWGSLATLCLYAMFYVWLTSEHLNLISTLKFKLLTYDLNIINCTYFICIAQRVWQIHVPMYHPTSQSFSVSQLKMLLDPLCQCV